jgi:hypothetical protein
MDNFYDSPELQFFLKSNRLCYHLMFQQKQKNALPLVKAKEAERPLLDYLL